MLLRTIVVLLASLLLAIASRGEDVPTISTPQKRPFASLSSFFKGPPPTSVSPRTSHHHYYVSRTSHNFLAGLGADNKLYEREEVIQSDSTGKKRHVVKHGIDGIGKTIKWECAPGQLEKDCLHIVTYDSAVEKNLFDTNWDKYGKQVQEGARGSVHALLFSDSFLKQLFSPLSLRFVARMLTCSSSACLFPLPLSARAHCDG